MKKIICVSMILAFVVGMVYITNDLYAVNAYQCWCHLPIIQTCGNYCKTVNSFCIYYQLLSASCWGNKCNQLWLYGCEIGGHIQYGGSPQCVDCEEGNGYGDDDWGGDGDYDPTSHTPLDASGNPMW